MFIRTWMWYSTYDKKWLFFKSYRKSDQIGAIFPTWGNQLEEVKKCAKLVTLVTSILWILFIYCTTVECRILLPPDELGNIVMIISMISSYQSGFYLCSGGTNFSPESSPESQGGPPEVEQPPICSGLRRNHWVLARRRKQGRICFQISDQEMRESDEWWHQRSLNINI